MILLLVLLLVPLGFFLSEGKWRESLLYSVVIGFLQDPLRKITPEQPAEFVLLALLGILLSAVVLFVRIGRINLVQMFSRDRTLISTIELFLALLALQTLNSALNIDSPVRTAIGIGFYLSPLIALWIGFQFALRPADVTRFLSIYSIMALLFAFTLLLAYLGYRGPLFEEITGGVQILIEGLGKYTTGFTGFWRSSEIASWHLATASCFILILGIYRREPWPIALASSLAITLTVLGTLTGRRKSLTLVAGFFALFSFFIVWRGDGKLRGNLLTGLSGGLLLLLLFTSLGGNPTTGGTFGAFLDRSSTVWGDIASRLSVVGFSTIQDGLAVGGPLGAGIGAAAQGAASLGSGAIINSGSAEGGLGKIVLELGLAGLIMFAAVLALLAKAFWRIILQLRYAPPSYRLLNMGLIAFLAANVVNFTAASQAYGDPFVLSILGLSAGFVLASPVVIQAHLVAQRQALARFQETAEADIPYPSPPGASRP